ncbi:phage holin family protein [Aeromicrobium terrae]|jgi:putative membrane protein|uniref:Phage holin family protein n=1 Tax=Aeromicrobium terrae TaxID=2498846 RepID=A0A5C8NDI6_9ACTN|nr:phage holin family protein [Aeromicrobium terrae]TXL57697.1 phage holin family protein [Aeromicrobium terrae]
MPRLITSWILSAASLAVAAWLLGSHMSIGVESDSTSDRLLTLAAVAAVFTIIDSFVGPVVKVLSLPFIIVTLGFALLVINALLLMLTDKITGELDVAFYVESFGWALLGSIVISIVNAILGGFAKR